MVVVAPAGEDDLENEGEKLSEAVWDLTSGELVAETDVVQRSEGLDERDTDKFDFETKIDVLVLVVAVLDRYEEIVLLEEDGENEREAEIDTVTVDSAPELLLLKDIVCDDECKLLVCSFVRLTMLRGSSDCDKDSVDAVAVGDLLAEAVPRGAENVCEADRAVTVRPEVVDRLFERRVLD